jgi:hypothetical protein
MLPLILAAAAAIVWSVLAVVGVRDGLRGRVVVIRSWADCALTAVLAGLLVIDLITCRRSAGDTQTIRVLTLVAGLPWLWKTRMANSNARDLWVVVPAKLTLVLLAASCAVLAISCASTALSRKADERTRVANAVLATGCAAATWGLFRMIRRLITASSSVPPAHRRTFHLDCYS